MNSESPNPARTPNPDPAQVRRGRRILILIFVNEPKKVEKENADELKAEVEALAEKIIAGEIVVESTR